AVVRRCTEEGQEGEAVPRALQQACPRSAQTNAARAGSRAIETTQLARAASHFQDLRRRFERPGSRKILDKARHVEATDGKPSSGLLWIHVCAFGFYHTKMRTV